MASSHAGDNPRETRLNEILADYLEARQRGEAPDRHAFSTKHPEYADELASFFADQDRFQQAAAPIKLAADALEPTLDPAPRPATGVGEARQQAAAGEHVRYFGDYEIIEEIARGGMGVVYRARQVNLKRIVALKMVLAGQLATRSEIQRFYAEAEAAAKLAHPNIVPIFEVGQHENQHYFSMAFVDGESLAHRVAAGVLEPREAARLMKHVAAAIAYAHVEGVIHRDLKPGNILIDKDGTPRVTDFGLAKRVEGEASGLTVTGQVLGTPSYMPPEQARGDSPRITQLSDVYSLGAVLYCLVTGRPPFQAANPVETLLQVMEQEPLSPRQLNSAVPLDLETIILKCLEKEPSRRYSSAQHLVDELARFLDGRPILARPVPSAERSWRWCRRHPATAALSVGIAASLFIGTLVSSYFAIKAHRQAGDARRSELAALSEKQCADEQAEQAARNAQRADEQAKVAEANSLRADAKTKEARRQLYAAHMNLAQSAWEDTRVAETVRLLNLYRPQARAAADDDLRGFEWYYWQRLVDSNGVTLKGHNLVAGVAFSPDGQRLAAASHDQTIKLWDVAAGQVSRTLKGHTHFVNSVVFSPDGQRLASASHDQTINVWDAATGQLSRSLKGHKGPVNCAAFSADGKRLASGGEDKTVKVWDAATGEELLSLLGHGSYITSVAFSPDGERLASASYDQTIKLWDLAKGQLSHTLKGHTGVVSCVVFSPNRKQLASASFDRTIKIWDALAGRESFTLRGHAGEVRSVAYSLDGQRLASGSDDKTVKVWDAATNQEWLTLKGHAKPATSVAFSPDGKRLASASHDGTVKLWDWLTGQESLTLKGGWKIVAYSPDGTRLASASLESSPTDTKVVYQSIRDIYKPVVKVWDVATGQVSLTLSGHSGEVTSVAFSPDGTRLASASVDQTVKVWDSATGQASLTLKGHTDRVLSVVFSPNGQLLASASGDGTIKLWIAATGEPSLTLKGHAASPTSLAFSADGKRLASSSFDQTIKVWDVGTGQAALTLEGHNGSITCVAFSRDGQRLASASYDRTVKTWDAATGHEALTLRGHSASITSVAFSPDGKRVASASEDHTVHVWDSATGQVTLTLKGHTDGVYGVAFSPDGRQLASASIDLTVKVWDARQGASTR